MNPLISVVIPVYNVENYLRQCLDSVINQTYKNLEIICVNDCTADSSDKILEEYARRDSRIIIKKNPKNLGLGLSRNEGIKIAKGKYIHCLDSDDWMALNAYETLLEYFQDDVDAVRFPYISHDEITHKEEYIGYSGEEFLYKKVNIYNTPNCLRVWSPSAWIKIYSRDFIINNSLYYNDYRCLEDIEYSVQSVLKAKNIIFIDTPLLHYRANRKNSLLSQKTGFINNIVKDTISTDKIAQNLPENTKEAILNYIYELLIMNSLDAYYAGRLSFSKMKQLFVENINADILAKTDIFNASNAYKLYLKVIKYTQIKFFLAYNTRRFIKEHFPGFTKKYFEIKKKLLKLI